MKGLARTVRRCWTPVLLTVLAGCGHGSTEQVETSDKVAVSTHAVERGAIHAVFTVTGVVKPASGAELVVTAPQSARIAEIAKAVGDRVRRGDVLVRFSIPALAAEVASRRAEMSRAEARLATASAAAQRLEGLYTRGVAARKEVDDAQRELADAQAGVTEAQSNSAATGELAARAVVRAPFAGVVASRGHNPGDLVDAGGDPILRVIDPGRLEVEAQAPPTAAASIAPGQSAVVYGPADGPGEPATVLTRPAALDSTTGAAVLRLGFTRPTALPSGSPVRVEIAGSEHRGVLLVPIAALVQEGSDTFVFTVDAKSHAHRRPVKVGVTSGSQVEVLSGVAAGEPVVVNGQAGLPDDAVVAATPATP